MDRKWDEWVDGWTDGGVDRRDGYMEIDDGIGAVNGWMKVQKGGTDEWTEE